MSDIEECEKAKVGRREKYPYSVWIMDLTQKMGAGTFINFCSIFAQHK